MSIERIVCGWVSRVEMSCNGLVMGKLLELKRVMPLYWLLGSVVMLGKMKNWMVVKTVRATNEVAMASR